MPSLCRRFAAHLEGIPVAYDDVVLDDGHLTPFQRELLAAARSVGWGEVVTYGGLAAPRRAAARGSGRGDLLRAEPLVARRPLPPGRRGRQGRAVRARRVRLRRERPQAPSARARGNAPVSTGALVADARAELAAVAPERRCDRLAEISALFHTAGHGAPPRARRASVPPRPRGVGGRTPGVRDPEGAARRVRDPHLPAAVVRPGRTHAAARRGHGPCDRRPHRGRRALA